MGLTRGGKICFLSYQLFKPTNSSKCPSNMDREFHRPISLLESSPLLKKLVPRNVLVKHGRGSRTTAALDKGEAREAGEAGEAGDGDASVLLVIHNS